MENVKYFEVSYHIMPTIRSVLVSQSGGASMRITLPGPWVKMNGVKHHDELQIIDHGVLIIIPPRMKKEIDVDKLAVDIKGVFAFLNQGEFHKNKD
jgi:hypothetical protein